MNLVLLAKALGAADEFNLQPVLLREALGVFSWSLSQRLCPLRVVKDANVMGVEIRRHPFRITQARQGALNQQAVVAEKHAGDLLPPALGQSL